MNTIFHRKIVNIFLTTSSNICFRYPQHMFWLRSKKIKFSLCTIYLTKVLLTCISTLHYCISFLLLYNKYSHVCFNIVRNSSCRTCVDPGAGDRKITKLLLVWTPWKTLSYSASIQCWAIISPPAKHHLNVLLAGQ